MGQHDEAIELNPTYMGAWHYRGITLNALGGRTSKAEGAFVRGKGARVSGLTTHFSFFVISGGVWAVVIYLV